MDPTLQIILIINSLGLIASFLARKFLKRNSLVIMIPTAFLYMSSMYTIYRISQEKSSHLESTSSELIPVQSKTSNPGASDPGTSDPEVSKAEPNNIDKGIEGSQKFDVLVKSNDEMKTKFIFSSAGINVSESLLLKFNESANSLGSLGNMQIIMLNESGELIEWKKYSAEHQTLWNEQYSLQLSIVQDEYVNKLNFQILSKDQVNKYVRLVILQKFDSSSQPQCIIDNKKYVLNASSPKNLTAKNLTAKNLTESDLKGSNSTESNLGCIGYTNHYWLNYAVGDFDSVSYVSQKDVNQENIDSVRIEKNIAIDSKHGKDTETNTVNFGFSVLTGPAQITKLEKYNRILNKNLSPILDVKSGFFASIKKFCIMPVLLVFEFLSSFMGPLITMVFIVIAFKVCTLYNSYRAHSFGKEVNRIMQVGIATKNQDAIRGALTNNKNLNIVSKIISVVLKLVFFMILYKIFQSSPLFYGERFLWVSDLSAPDSCCINNLFGLLPMANTFIPTFIPRIGLLPILLGVIFFADLYFKSMQATKQQRDDQRMSVTIMCIVLVGLFSRMQAILCLYMILNNILEIAQVYFFDNVLKMGGPSIGSGSTKKVIK